MDYSDWPCVKKIGGQVIAGLVLAFFIIIFLDWATLPEKFAGIADKSNMMFGVYPRVDIMSGRGEPSLYAS